MVTETIACRRRHLGFVAEADLFGSSQFGVSPAEAATMDPQQRLVLEHGYAALVVRTDSNTYVRFPLSTSIFVIASFERYVVYDYMACVE